MNSVLFGNRDVKQVAVTNAQTLRDGRGQSVRQRISCSEGGAFIVAL
jgi:hypothetical protein